MTMHRNNLIRTRFSFPDDSLQFTVVRLYRRGAFRCRIILRI